ncbi:MFS transporter [Amycolatopsis sp. H20-H5]|uniref:MFS transporter n=1 Tax=Amycolatopsis sp. H20-H5 TaxID=3046309 RepID=UPI002DB95F78|nr:MFS transporter [Amycolatopsis sp. H20-H5]MEC3976098.1 MFS transporter [Amycolatopsis sp. H20-H5]
MLPDVLGDGELYVAGMAVRNVTVQTAQLAGFAGGGLLVAALSPQGGLIVDAVTFALSGVLVLAGVKLRPAAEAEAKHSILWQAWHGVRLCAGDRGLSSLIGLAALAGLYMAPEGIAAPYAAGLSDDGFAVGLIMAADPAGSVLGALLVMRVPERWRLNSIGVLAAATGLPLLVCFTRPGLVVSLVAFAMVGVLSTMYLVPMSAALARGTANERRAQVMGLYSTTVVTAQGLGALLTGAVAQWLSPATAIAVSGVAVLILGAPLASRWLQTLAGEPARWAPQTEGIGG